MFRAHGVERAVACSRTESSITSALRFSPRGGGASSKSNAIKSALGEGARARWRDMQNTRYSFSPLCPARATSASSTRCVATRWTRQPSPSKSGEREKSASRHGVVNRPRSVPSRVTRLVANHRSRLLHQLWARAHQAPPGPCSRWRYVCRRRSRRGQLFRHLMKKQRRRGRRRSISERL